MGKIKFIILPFILILSSFSLGGEALCRFDMKDYDSPGYGLPRRNGYRIEGRFGCVYRCTCPNGTQWKVSHVFEEKRIDLAVFKTDTGGPKRAKWFICPHSVQEDSWRPMYDEIGHIIAYNVEPNYEDFPAEKMSSSPQIQDWLQNTCQNP